MQFHKRALIYRDSYKEKSQETKQIGGKQSVRTISKYFAKK